MWAIVCQLSTVCSAASLLWLFGVCVEEDEVISVCVVFVLYRLSRVLGDGFVLVSSLVKLLECLVGKSGIDVFLLLLFQWLFVYSDGVICLTQSPNQWNSLQSSDSVKVRNKSK